MRQIEVIVKDGKGQPLRIVEVGVGGFNFGTILDLFRLWTSAEAIHLITETIRLIGLGANDQPPSPEQPNGPVISK